VSIVQGFGAIDGAQYVGEFHRLGQLAAQRFELDDRGLEHGHEQVERHRLVT
jgi:hypothetical protein